MLKICQVILYTTSRALQGAQILYFHYIHILLNSQIKMMKFSYESGFSWILRLGHILRPIGLKIFYEYRYCNSIAFCTIKTLIYSLFCPLRCFNFWVGTSWYIVLWYDTNKMCNFSLNIHILLYRSIFVQLFLWLFSMFGLCFFFIALK